MKAILLAIIITSFFACNYSSKKEKSNKFDTTSKLFLDTQNFKSDIPNFTMDKGSLGKVQKLRVWFVGIPSASAQWAIKEPETKSEYGNMIFLEQANNSILNSDTLFTGFEQPGSILVEGQFYTKIGFPRNYRPRKEEYPTPSRVFKYTSLKILPE